MVSFFLIKYKNIYKEDDISIYTICTNFYSYHKKRFDSIFKLSNRYFSSGTPKEIRTLDPLIRSQVLYPAELWAHGGSSGIRTRG